VSLYLLYHRHEPRECPIVFAAWRGFASPLRGREALASCLFGDHQIWWEVEARSDGAALDHLPWYVARRTTAIRVREVVIP
jgi:hypothetical protein